MDVLDPWADETDPWEDFYAHEDDGWEPVPPCQEAAALIGFTILAAVVMSFYIEAAKWVWRLIS